MRRARGEPVGSEPSEGQLAAWVGWYNKRRLHGACGGRPPTEYEGLYERGELPSLVLRPNQRVCPKTEAVQYSRPGSKAPGLGLFVEDDAT
jgi:hypothetical protein